MGVNNIGSGARAEQKKLAHGYQAKGGGALGIGARLPGVLTQVWRMAPGWRQN